MDDRSSVHIIICDILLDKTLIKLSLLSTTVAPCKVYEGMFKDEVNVTLIPNSNIDVTDENDVSILNSDDQKTSLVPSSGIA